MKVLKLLWIVTFLFSVHGFCFTDSLLFLLVLLNQMFCFGTKSGPTCLKHSQSGKYIFTRIVFSTCWRHCDKSKIKTLLRTVKMPQRALTLFLMAHGFVCSQSVACDHWIFNVTVPGVEACFADLESTYSLGVVSQPFARYICGSSLHPNRGHIFRPKSKDELEIFVSHVKSFWTLEEGRKVGFWLDFERRIVAQLGDANYQLIRSNKTLFLGSDGSVMPKELWREGQPGDMRDGRDERCVARKRVLDESIRGADDYRCHTEAGSLRPAQKHRVFCATNPSVWSELKSVDGCKLLNFGWGNLLRRLTRSTVFIHS